MKIHEHQAKDIFASYGIPVPKGEVATTPDEAGQAVGRMGGRAIIKAGRSRGILLRIVG